MGLKLKPLRNLLEQQWEVKGAARDQLIPNGVETRTTNTFDMG